MRNSSDPVSNPAIEAQLAEILARMAGVERQGEATAKDVREARDGVTRLTAVQAEQRVGERLEGLRRDIEREASERRSDLVNVAAQLGAKITALDEKLDSTADVLKVDYTKLNTDMGKRVGTLESLRDQAQGAGKLMTWAQKFGPWAVSILAAALAIGDKFGK